MNRLPLGDYDAFSAWTGRPRAWGPEGEWRAWFAGGVIDGLATVLDEHITAVRSSYRRAQPAAIGCVPWLTNNAIVDRLIALAACCIVVDKGAAYVPRRLLDADLGFPNVLPGLRDRAPAADGAAMLLGPYSPMPSFELGPIRVAGWPGDEVGKPLVHAKLLVLGELVLGEIGPDKGQTMEWLWFEPRSVWWSSANWTEPARNHLEVGFWCDDKALVGDATAFVGDLLAFSEQVEAVTPGPEPDLIYVEYDEEAMREASTEQEWAEGT